jgi:hypothetical protein
MAEHYPEYFLTTWRDFVHVFRHPFVAHRLILSSILDIRVNGPKEDYFVARHSMFEGF